MLQTQCWLHLYPNLVTKKVGLETSKQFCIKPALHLDVKVILTLLCKESTFQNMIISPSCQFHLGKQIK